MHESNYPLHNHISGRKSKENFFPRRYPIRDRTVHFENFGNETWYVRELFDASYLEWICEYVPRKCARNEQLLEALLDPLDSTRLRIQRPLFRPSATTTQIFPLPLFPRQEGGQKNGKNGFFAQFRDEFFPLFFAFIFHYFLWFFLNRGNNRKWRIWTSSNLQKFI